MGKNVQYIIIGLIMIVLALAMFPIVLDAVATLLAWTGVGSASLSDFTGLTALVTITPLLVFIGLLGSGGWLTFKGFRSGGERSGGKKRGSGLH